MSQTRIGKLEPKVVFTARWHMISRCMYGVLSDGLSGRVPHGTIHTSSTRPECKISAAHCTWAFVIGLKEPLVG